MKRFMQTALVLSLITYHLSLITLRADPVEDEVDKAIERGLEYLLASQRADGTYGQGAGETAAVPALAAMACLATGHVPGDMKYGVLIERSLDYILSIQNASGYFGEKSGGKMYAHAIATLLLTELSGMVDAEHQAKIDVALPKAVRVILDAQNVPKRDNHVGGWRYTPDAKDSDTSCSGWCLMALRSARHNGCQIPPDAIGRAVKYMRAHHSKKLGCFGYQNSDQHAVTLSGAGILCLELCGKHEDPDSLAAAKYLMSVYRTEMDKQGFRYYGMYYASQGLFQIGGENWKEFSEWMYSTWVPRQRADGSWPHSGGEGNSAYTTSMIILAFAVPYRQLPVYQRDETVDD